MTAQHTNAQNNNKPSTHGLQSNSVSILAQFICADIRLKLLYGMGDREAKRSRPSWCSAGWDQPLAGPDDHAGSEDEPDDTEWWKAMTAEEAGEEFVKLVTDMKLKGASMTAKHACLLSFWAARAGANGPVGALGFHPGAASGNYSRHYDSATQTKPNNPRYYTLDLPLFRKADATRAIEPYPVVPAHEALRDEIIGEPSMATKLATLLPKLPPAYTEHVVVKSAPPGMPIYPVVLYMDGIPFTRHDGCFSVLIYNVVTQRRHLCICVKKSFMCRCGCHGWCTLRTLWEFMHWCVKAFSTGVPPTARHDNSPFLDLTDALRMADLDPYTWRACVIGVKGDLMEHAVSLGLPAVGSGIGPCPACHVTGAEFLEYVGANAVSLPWARKTFQEYVDACAACERTVVLDRSTIIALRPNLEFDRRSDGNRGRCLIKTVGPLGLMAGDRLEPTSDRLDVYGIDRENGGQFHFWRRSAETFVRHRNPLFDEALGIVPSMLMPCWLHTLSLGLFKVTCSFVFWRLFSKNVWRAPPGPEEARLDTTVVRLQADLFSWYAAESAANREHTQVQRLVPSMFGTSTTHAFGLHGAETNGMLMYFNALLVQHGDRLDDPARVRRLASTAATLYTLIKENPIVFPLGVSQASRTDHSHPRNTM